LCSSVHFFTDFSDLGRSCFFWWVFPSPPVQVRWSGWCGRCRFMVLPLSVLSLYANRGKDSIVWFCHSSSSPGGSWHRHIWLLASASYSAEGAVTHSRFSDISSLLLGPRAYFVVPASCSSSGLGSVLCMIVPYCRAAAGS
jgi:hypothetical protein